jgi:4-amino-4-deoxy-L-arabinose transferase-like glycosyltransferase
MVKMPRKIPHWVWLVLPLAYFLYFYHLNAAGLLGPDEPRYASIGREMARSGDWVTPRLWGEPWFEKPALLYWMTASGFRLGLGPELAPRLPVALLAVCFLGFYWWILRREFGGSAAWLATLILGTAAGWVAFSQIGVTDLPLAATFSAAMLLALPWISKGDGRWLPAASALLGLAVLAKGLVPLVLALPLLGVPLVRPRGWRDLIRGRVLAPFWIVALPWYVLCYLRNGRVFLDVFFRQHQFDRFSSAALQHGQPWWFYGPILLAGLVPWTPLLLVLARRGFWSDPRRLFLLAWIAFGLVFFSVAVNKLPGYVLPLVPAVSALMGIGLNEVSQARPWLAACALLLVAYPMAAQVLPAAVAMGLSHASRPPIQAAWLLGVGAAALILWAPLARWRLAAAAALATCATAGIVYLKAVSLPNVSRLASARAIWSQIEPRAEEVCVDAIPRDSRYGLNFYSVAPLPDCNREPKPLMVRQPPGEPPYLAPLLQLAPAVSPALLAPVHP